MKKGIIIYAMGHENYYFMAEALAASLQCNGVKDAGIAVCAICDNKEKFRYPELFDDFVIIDKEEFVTNGKFVFMDAIMLAYDLSPYDLTLKLDADMIWLNGRNPADLFEQLKKVDITFSNRVAYPISEDTEESFWAKEADIRKAYKLKGDEKMYIISAEFMYFKKCAAAKKLFDQAKKVYANKKIHGKYFSNSHFTEELAFQIAFMLTGIYPHKEAFTPVYNTFMILDNAMKGLFHYQLPAYIYAYSIFGNNIPNRARSQYNILSKHYFYKLGLQGAYLAENKSNFLPERVKL